MNTPSETSTDSRVGLRATVRMLRDTPRAYRLALPAVLLVGLAARIVLVGVAQPALVSDARDYDVLARNLVEGRGYVQVYEGETEAFEGFTFRAFRPPGYPVFLATVYTVVGWQPAFALLANVAADVVTQICFVLIALRLLGRGPALLVQVLLAMHVLWTPSLTTESLHTALLAIIAMMLVFGTARRSIAGALICGAFIAAALFVRPITVCVFPILLWQALRPRPTQRGVLLLLLALLPPALGLGLWGLRNQRVLGQFVPLTTNLGHHNAWDYGLHADQLFAHLREQGLGEAEINTVLLELERRVLVEQPGAVLRMWMRRGADLLSLRPAWELQQVLWRRTFDSSPEGSLVGRLYRAAYAQYYVTYPLAAVGVILLALRRRSLGGLWGLAIGYVVVHALVSRGDIRLAAPLYPVMCVLAAGVWRVLDDWRHPPLGGPGEV